MGWSHVPSWGNFLMASHDQFSVVKLSCFLRFFRLCSKDNLWIDAPNSANNSSYYPATSMCSRCCATKAWTHALMHTHTSLHEHRVAVWKGRMELLTLHNCPINMHNTQCTRDGLSQFTKGIQLERNTVKSNQRCSRTVDLCGPWPQVHKLQLGWFGRWCIRHPTISAVRWDFSDWKKTTRRDA
jgi:hypothetical protein